MKYRHIPFSLIQNLILEVLRQNFRMGSPWASIVFMLHIHHISSHFVMGHNSPRTKDRREFHWRPSAIGRPAWYPYTPLPHIVIRVALLCCSWIEGFAGVETTQLESFSRIDDTRKSALQFICGSIITAALSFSKMAVLFPAYIPLNADCSIRQLQQKVANYGNFQYL
jgi:hypothetical protein